MGRKSIKKTLSFKQKKSSDTKPEYVSKRLVLDLEQLKQEGAATYILDESVMQVPVDGDNVKEINEKDLNLTEMHEKALATKGRVMKDLQKHMKENLKDSLFNVDTMNQRTEDKQKLGKDISNSFKMIGKGLTTGLGAGVNVFGQLAKKLDVLDLAQQKKVRVEEKIELDKIDSLNGRNNFIESYQGKDFKDILEQGMLYSSLNNLSIDTKLESTNSISSQSRLSLQTIRIKLIKLKQ